MPGKHRNRSVLVVDEDNKPFRRVTPQRADVLVATGCGEWIEPAPGTAGSRVLRRLPPNTSTTANQIEATGMWRMLVERGNDPRERDVRTLPHAVRWHAQKNAYRFSRKS